MFEHFYMPATAKVIAKCYINITECISIKSLNNLITNNLTVLTTYIIGKYADNKRSTYI